MLFRSGGNKKARVKDLRERERKRKKERERAFLKLTSLRCVFCFWERGWG